MKKLIYKIVEDTCEQCPYAFYHSDFGFEYCVHPQIKDKDKFSRKVNIKIESDETGQMYFKYPPILEICPLTTIK